MIPRLKFSEKLLVVVLPSILLFEKAVVVDRIIGFTDLGNRDDSPTCVLEWRIAQKDVISYKGDKTTPPKPNDRPNISFHDRKTIRVGRDESDSSEEEDISSPFKDKAASGAPADSINSLNIT